MAVTTAPSTTASLLSTQDVARRLNLNTRTVTRMARDGDIAAVRCGRVLRYDPTEVERFVNGGGAVRPTASLDEVVERLVAEAPALTEVQHSQLSSLLAQPVGTR